MTQVHQPLIISTAKKHLINPNLVTAIVGIESAYNTDAVRYESHYKWLYKPDEFAKQLGLSVETESELQKFSYGLMQCMGAVARENGFSGPLFRLCRPDLGLEYGCAHFAKYFRKYNDLKRTLAAYNGGPGAILADGTFKNESYVNKVMEKYLSLRT